MEPSSPSDPRPVEPLAEGPPPPSPAVTPTPGAGKALWNTVLVFIAYSLAQLLGFALWAGSVLIGAAASPAAVPPEPSPAGPIPFGLLLALGTLMAAPFGVWLTVHAARRHGAPAGRYLGLRKPTFGQTLLWTAGLAAAAFGYEALADRLDRPSMPDFMVEIHRTAVVPPLLWLAVVVAAPVFEEILFRGYLLEGLRRSRLGWPGAVLVSSLLFALPHLQYDLFDLGSIVVLGMLLGLARWSSGSTCLAIGLHALTNAMAMLQGPTGG